MSHLKLLPGRVDESIEASGLGPAVGAPMANRGVTRRVDPGRPWDELEPLWLPAGGPTRRLMEAASSVGLEPGIAVAVVLERGMACAGLSRIEDGTLVARLDRCAAAAGPCRPLSGAAALYLRQLAGGGPSRGAPENRPVLIPGRVAVRLPGVGEDRLAGMLAGDLRLAIRWERAALLAGRTISEWAAWEALELVQAPR